MEEMKKIEEREVKEVSVAEPKAMTRKYRKKIEEREVKEVAVAEPKAMTRKYRKKIEETEVKKETESSEPKFRYAWEKDKERDYRMVRGVFKNEVNPGHALKFYYKKYPGPLMEFIFQDNHAYTIPYMVAKHLHEECYIKIHERSQDEDGKPLTIVGQKKKTYDFISPDIIEEGSKNANILSVQRGF